MLDTGPTLKQHWFNVSCLLGHDLYLQLPGSHNSLPRQVMGRRMGEEKAIEGGHQSWKIIIDLVHQHQLSCLIIRGRGLPRLVVSTAAFHAGVRGSFPGLGSLKETNFFSPFTCKKISNPVSGGQCHLTILRRFSWPNLDYMCTKVA